MNISSSINNHFANKANLPVSVNQSIQANSNNVQAKHAVNLSEIDNAINDQTITDKSARFNQDNVNINEKRTQKIDPNLLDRVFRLRSKEEGNIHTNRRSDLYLQTEVISSKNKDEIGIGLDLYI